jgi:superfamily I DNA/RNA helicase
MFSVSNAISYDNMMVYGTEEHKGDLWFGESSWIEVPATSRSGNSVPEQVAVAVQMAAEFEKHYDIKAGGKYNLYLITPFKDVRNALEDALRSRIRTRAVVSGMFGTVHTFQGKEADVVIFVLGGTRGSISSFAADKANLLNVALTRAKKRVYVIGAKADWANAPFYSTLYHNPKLEKRDTVPQIILPNLRKGVN